MILLVQTYSFHQIFHHELPVLDARTVIDFILSVLVKKYQ